ncbi:MAG: SdiA-regulated domain-containing protein [Candidatus Marinimicrobia bacterium]|nr:SdiA-regulated domain-containing protein [FCB group bacterium]MBL7026478.1 SdiA-regulated domain-containing protein [Candidatus Neomarinimicrobiota bacterium]
MDVSEPSGLTQDASGNFLYCVSDPPVNKIHKLDLAGNLIQTLDYVGQDLEGISYDTRDSTIWIVDEAETEITHLTETGQILSQTPINISIPDSKSGLEGICFRSGENDIHVIKQQNPATVVKIDSNLVTLDSKNFDKGIDITGICRGREPDEFLIISAGEKQLYEWTWEGGLLATYNFDVKQAEGVVYDASSSLVYIVCDAESILYTFEFPE